MATQLSIARALTQFRPNRSACAGARLLDSQRLINGVSAFVLAVSAMALIGCKEGITSGPLYGNDYQAGSPSSTPSGTQSEETPSDPTQSPSEPAPSNPTPAPSPSEPPPSEPAPAPSEPAPAPSEPAPAPAPAPTPITCSSTGLATTDLAGQCRAAPTTMGALEIGSSGGSSFASLTGTQTTTRSLQVSWQPLGTNTSGYMVYFGKTAETANVFVSDVSTTNVSYNAARDLGLYSGDSVCFRIYAYGSTRALSSQSTLVCTVV